MVTTPWLKETKQLVADGQARILDGDKEAASDLLDDDEFRQGGHADRRRLTEQWARKIRCEAELSARTRVEALERQVREEREACLNIVRLKRRTAYSQGKIARVWGFEDACDAIENAIQKRNT